MSAMMMSAMALAEKRWMFVASTNLLTATSSSTLLTTPGVAQIGDLGLIVWSSTATGTAPSGWTALATGSTTHYYKIYSVSGSEFINAPGSGQGYIMFFRPIGGAAYYAGGVSQSPATVDHNLSSINDPGMLVSVGNAVGSVTDFAANIPPGPDVATTINQTSAPALFASFRGVGRSAALVDLRVLGSGSPRQTFALFGIS